MADFITIDLLATFAGMAAAVTLATEIIKFFVPANPKWIALFLAFVATFVMQVLPNPLTAQGLLLAFINWLLVTGTSVGLFETTLKGVDAKLATLLTSKKG